jgi:hypothetical protein
MSASWIALALSLVDTTFAASDVFRSNAAFAPIDAELHLIFLLLTLHSLRRGLTGKPFAARYGRHSGWISCSWSRRSGLRECSYR